MSDLQQTYKNYIEKRELFERLDTDSLAEIQTEQTAVAVKQTLTERLLPARMLSKAYRQEHEIDLKNQEIRILNQQEAYVQLDKETLLQEIIKLQDILPSIVLLDVHEVDRLEWVINRILRNIAQVEIILPQLQNSVNSSNKKATVWLVAEGADLLVENRRQQNHKGILSKVIDGLSTFLSQRTFASHDEINEQLQVINPLVEEINQLSQEISEIEARQDTIDHRKKPIKWINQIKDYRVVEYIDLLQDLILKNQKFDVWSILSGTVQYYVKRETNQLSSQIVLLRARLEEVKSWCEYAKKDIAMYRALTKDDDGLQLRSIR